MFRIKQELKKQGISQKELALKMDVSPQYINQELNGKPSILSLERIAKALNVNVVDLFEPNPDGASGFIEYKGVTHKLNSTKDLREFLKTIEKD